MNLFIAVVVGVTAGNIVKIFGAPVMVVVVVVALVSGVTSAGLTMMDRRRK